MPPHSRVWKSLHRAGLALFGVMLALFGAGIVLLAVDWSRPFSVGALVAGALGLLLTVAGLRQVWAAVVGQIPKWYTELLLFGGVLGSGGRRH